MYQNTLKARLATPSDIEGLLALQKLNLYGELTKAQRTKGFVTTPFTIPQIEEIMRDDGVFVVERSEQIIAYAFAGTWKYFEQWAIFPFMAARLPDLSFNGGEITTANSFQYGPVCIDVQYRGKKILNTIFEAMRLQFVEHFPLSITFINKVNAISFRAHQKLGWEVVDEFDFNDNRYLGLAFDMKKSVLFPFGR